MRPPHALVDDPYLTTPVEARTADQWDEFDHLNALAADEARLIAARELTRQAAAAQTPVRSTT